MTFTKKAAGELTNTDLATARVNLIMKQTASTAGDFADTTDGGKVIVVSRVLLTVCRVPCTMRGRKISPVPPARFVATPLTASQALPTKG